MSIIPPILLFSGYLFLWFAINTPQKPIMTHCECLLLPYQVKSNGTHYQYHGIILSFKNKRTIYLENDTFLQNKIQWENFTKFVPCYFKSNDPDTLLLT
jgi:hypothetical protein